MVERDRSGSLAGRDLVSTDESAREKRELGQEKLPYRPHNDAFSLESVAPAAMVESMNASLSDIEKEVGPIDKFVRSELGYDKVEEVVVHIIEHLVRDYGVEGTRSRLQNLEANNGEKPKD